MSEVVLHHPTLPAAQTITVDEQSVAVHEASGWQRKAKAPAKKSTPKKKVPAKKTPAEPVNSKEK